MEDFDFAPSGNEYILPHEVEFDTDAFSLPKHFAGLPTGTDIGFGIDASILLKKTSLNLKDLAALHMRKSQGIDAPLSMRDRAIDLQMQPFYVVDPFGANQSFPHKNVLHSNGEQYTGKKRSCDSPMESYMDCEISPSSKRVDTVWREAVGVVVTSLDSLFLTDDNSLQNVKDLSSKKAQRHSVYFML